MSNFLLEIAIYLHGEDLNPDRITKCIGVQPSRCQIKGDVRSRSAGLLSNMGMWVLNAKSESNNVSERIQCILDEIGPVVRSLDQIQGVEFAYLDIFATSDLDSEKTFEMRILPAQVKRLEELGLGIQVTVPSAVRHKED